MNDSTAGPVSPAGPAVVPGADAAPAEADPQPKKIEVRGREFTIPAVQPFRAVYAAKEIIKAQTRSDNSAAAAAMLDVAEAYLGSAQMNDLVNAAESVEDGFKAASEVVEAANAVYGMAEGESSASPSS